MFKSISLMFISYAALAACACAAAEVRSVTSYDAVATRKMELAMASSIDAAISTPLNSLYVKAKSGGAQDQLRFALALMAGRDTAGLPDPAVTQANIAKAQALDVGWYKAQKALSETPSDDETDMWLRMVYRELWSCLPCRDGAPPEEEAKNSTFAAYARLNDPEYWLHLAYPEGVTPVELMLARTCLTQVTLSLKADAARKWLIEDYKTAAGRRATLNRRLFNLVSDIANAGDDTGCAEGRYAAWRENLKAQRPELEAMMSGYLAERLGDPRHPWGYMKVSSP